MKQTGIIIPLASFWQDCSYFQCYVNIYNFVFCTYLVLCNCSGSLLFSLILIMEVHPSLVHASIIRVQRAPWLFVFVMLVCASVDIFHSLLLKRF